jgi:hypothetical protein
MTGTIPRTPTRRRPKALAPMIREVCLVGDARRVYRHSNPGPDNRRAGPALPDSDGQCQEAGQALPYAKAPHLGKGRP